MPVFCVPVVAVVVPAVVLGVPGVEPAREADQSVPMFSPHAEPEDDLVAVQRYHYRWCRAVYGR